MPYLIVIGCFLRCQSGPRFDESRIHEVFELIAAPSQKPSGYLRCGMEKKYFSPEMVYPVDESFRLLEGCSSASLYPSVRF